MANDRLYGFWGGLTEALQTGRPQNEIKQTGRSMFEELYGDPARLEQFMQAMVGISMGNFHALADKFDFSRYQSRLRRRWCHGRTVARPRAALPPPPVHVS